MDGGGGGQDTVNREQRKDHKSKSIFTTIFGQWCVVDKPERPQTFKPYTLGPLQS